jgi:glycosyltransferase involved in cell wall biosynthesis
VADTPANRELVVPGETGFLASPGDRAGFGRLANTILNDPALARRVAAAAQQRIANVFSVESMVEKHAAVYRGVRGRGPGATG